MPTLTEQSTLTKKQTKRFGPRAIAGWGANATIIAGARYDDECGNGHNTFAITASIPGQAGGCLHTEIAEVFPELAPLIKWHLCSSDGPMHYLANTVFLAGTKDCNGREAGEPYNFETFITFGSNPIEHKFGKRFTQFLTETKAHPNSERFDFEVIAVPHENRNGETYDFAPKHTFGGFDARWFECPFDTEAEALNFLKALQTCDPQFIEKPTAWAKASHASLTAHETRRSGRTPHTKTSPR